MAEIMKFNKETIGELATNSKNAGEQLKEMWNSLKEKSLSTLDASWAGKDAAAYTTKVLEKENSVLAVCAALELLSKKFTEALELIKNNEEDAYRAIENGGSGRTPDGGYVTEPAPTDSPVPPTQPMPTIQEPAPSTEPQQPETPPQQPVETPPAQTAPPVDPEMKPEEMPNVTVQPETPPQQPVAPPQQPVETPPAQTEVPVDPGIQAPTQVPTYQSPSPAAVAPQQPVAPPPVQPEIPVDPDIATQPLPTVVEGGVINSPTMNYISGKAGTSGGRTGIATQTAMLN